MKHPRIKFNEAVKLIISDVDETIADLYVKAEPEMIARLSDLLDEGKGLFLVSGAGLQRIRNRIVDHLPAERRKQVLISHCSGAEVWGFDNKGELLAHPYYSVYEQEFTEVQRDRWRQLVQKIIEEHRLVTYPATAIAEFKRIAGDNPLAVMLEDRGPQITLEVVNGYNITAAKAREAGFDVPTHLQYYDIRDTLLPRALELFREANLPVTPRTGGEFALDFAVEGINKTTSVKHVTGNEGILNHLGLSKDIISRPDNIEIWGDKFSMNRGGTDRHMSEALPKEVRSIDFREENSQEFLPGYNIVIWDGEKHLHHGLLEFLRSRNIN